MEDTIRRALERSDYNSYRRLRPTKDDLTSKARKKLTARVFKKSAL